MRLKAAGLDGEATKILPLLHGAMWTAATELFRELDKAILGILSGPNGSNILPQIRQEIRRISGSSALVISFRQNRKDDVNTKVTKNAKGHEGEIAMMRRINK
jgi:hypothetical protein